MEVNIGRMIIKFVGVRGFEPPASPSRTVRPANQRRGHTTIDQFLKCLTTFIGFNLSFPY